MTALVGTRHLVRLALRRDRIVLPVWVLVIGLLPASTAGAYGQLYPDQASRASLTAGMGANPSIRLLYGPPFDLSTAGGFTAWRFGVFLPLFAALACLFTVTRHTRQEEDTGRQELLSSTVTGRYAALAAALITAGIGAVATGLLVALGLVGAGLPAGGSVAFALGTTLTGLVFAAVAAIAVQLAEYSRTANGIAAAVLGAAFLLRAVGDSATDISWLSWLSPLGWSTRIRPFAGDRFAVALPLVAAAVVLGAVACLLLPRRDVGMGILPARPGPAVAARGLRSPFALAWRMHRGLLIGWAVGFAVMGALFGSLAAGIGDVVGDSAQAQQMFERLGGAQNLVDTFLAAIANIFGLIAALYAVQATLRMRSEETALRLEPLLATGVRRLSWAGSHLAFSLLGATLLLVVAGLFAGLLHGLRVDDVAGQLPAVLGATVAQVPAVWVVVGIAVVVFGFAPKLSTVAWAVAALFLMLSLFGPVVQAPQVLLDLSPFTHVPKLPSAEFTVTPFAWLLGIAVVTLAAGLTGFRRRDIG
ncbi:ABC transporter permease [Amycolatopsis thermophila]|uniref:ABC-2 type transport system permease protein n=1 Tax=Amycolatopsis thermophila TaxID=206084 RepID=A0ABU0ERB5_9PSEU|nr:ABC transporter permease [Amycolatopsis thermophila]MDQ0377838.1 ABC-2 type transport system permease protein [Amycolatopsis thermophila]